MKDFIKKILKRLGLLNSAKEANFWLTRFDSKTTHPRKNLIRFYSQFIKKGDLCFDIGANIGRRASIFLKLGARVICVEPQPACLNELYKGFSSNKLVSIEPRGVAEKEGFLNLFICNKDSKNSTMSEEFKMKAVNLKRLGYLWDESKRVAVTTLDRLIELYGMPAFCNIDIEGFEVYALKGLTKPIPIISFEFFGIFFEELKSCIESLSAIGRYRFNFIVGEPSSGEGLILPQWSEPDLIYSNIDSLKDKNPELVGDIYAKLL